MAAKTERKVAGSIGGEGHLPEVKQRRKMLKEAIGNLQTQGYNAHLNLIIAEAQVGKTVTVPTERGARSVERGEYIRDLGETCENTRRSVARLQAELDALPESDDGAEEDVKE